MNSGDTHGLMSTALVLLMTMPGLAFFTGDSSPEERSFYFMHALLFCAKSVCSGFVRLLSGLPARFSRTNRQFELGRPKRCRFLAE